MPVFVCHETSPDEGKGAQENEISTVEVASPESGPVTGNSDIRAYELPGGKMVRAIRVVRINILCTFLLDRE